jgi:predicted NAD-dependent protein-ADP-ribosyltransferase YbiA (DUF1768 family)
MISGNSLDADGSGVDKVEISLQRVSDGFNWTGTDWDYGEHWLSALGTDEWSYNVSEVQWTSGDQYIIHSRAVDRTVNTEIPDAKVTFRYDAIKPWRLNVNLNKGLKYTTFRNVHLSLDADDIGSGVAQMSFSNDGINWSVWKTYNVSEIYELTDGDGEKTVYFRVMDYAGNIGEPVFDQIIYDSTSPEELSIQINNDAEYTKSTDLVLDFNAIDALSGIKEMSISYDGTIWEPWEPFVESKTISTPSGATDGEIRIYMKVSDYAGNIAEPVFDIITLDRIAPQSLSIKVNGGQQEVSDTEVTLDLSAVDLLSGVDQMSISTDGVTWSDWEPYITNRTFNLPSDITGTKIYFRVTDHAGNLAEPVFTSVSFKTKSDDPTDPERESDEKTSPDSNGSLYWAIIPIVIIILLMIIFGFVYRKKQKEKVERELLSNSVTVKPGLLSQPTPEPSNEQIPIEKPDNEVPVQLTTIPPSTGDDPQLATAQTAPVAQVAAPAPVPQVAQAPQHPQLPPAQITDPEPDSTTSIATPITEPIAQSTSTNNGNGIIPTPPLITPEQSTSTGPLVHLPENEQ